MDILYAGVSLITIVIGVTQVVKDAGFPKKYIKLFAIVLGFVMFGGSKVVEVYPAAQVAYDIIFTGLSGISAIGLYDAAKSFVQKPAQPPVQ